MGKSFEDYLAAWNLIRVRHIYLAPGERSLRKARPVPEPKASMEVAGMRVVLDAPAVRLKQGGYPE